MAGQAVRPAGCASRPATVGSAGSGIASQPISRSSSSRSRGARVMRHHLLELCGLVGAGVFGTDGVYDP